MGALYEQDACILIILVLRAVSQTAALAQIFDYREEKIHER